MPSHRAQAPLHEIFPHPPEPSRSTLPQPGAASGDDGAGTVRLASGRSLEWQASGDGAEQVRIRGSEGEIELEVVLTDSGPRLRFRAAALALEADGKVEVDCDEFHVRAARGIVHETDGDIAERVAGNAVTVVKGDLRMTARTAGMRAIRGDVRLKANDDVKLEGERIKLNC